MSTLESVQQVLAPAAQSGRQAVDKTVQFLCVWSGPLATVLALLGMVIVGGFIPATDPSASSHEIADFYINNLNSIRFGMVISMVAFSLFVPFGVILAIQTRRSEGAPVLTYMQVACTAIAALEGVISTVIWLTAAYRPEVIDPEITRMLHDMGWICFLVTVPPFSIWAVAVGLAILRDNNIEPLFPRWIGFFNFWAALLFLPTLLLPFFKTGPFAYNGLLALYIPFGTFFVWMVTMTLAMLRSFKLRLAADDIA